MKTAPILLIICIAVCGCGKPEEASNEIEGRQRSGEAAGRARAGNDLSTASIEAECRKLKARSAEGLSVDERRQLLDHLKRLARTEPSKAYELLATYHDMNDTEIATAFLTDVMKNHGQSVVVDLLREMKHLMTDQNENRFMVALFDALGAEPLLEAGTVEFLKEFGKRDIAAGPLTSLLRMRARRSGAHEIVKLVEELGLRSEIKDRTLVSLGGMLLKQDPSEALIMLSEVKDVDRASVAYQNLFENWFAADSLAATSAFLKLPWKEKASVLGNPLVMNKVLQSGGAEAVWGALDEMPLTRSGFDQVAKMLEVLAPKDPERALRKIEEYAGLSGADQLVVRTFSELGRVDADSALKHLSNLDEGVREQAITGLLIGSVRNGIDVSVAWVSGQNLPLSAGNIAAFAEAISAQDPEKAWQLIQSPNFAVGAHSPVRSEILSVISKDWTSRDVVGAAQWVMNLSEIDSKAAVVPLIASWTDSAPAEASQWLLSLPQGPGREAGARELIRQIKPVDAEMANRWKKWVESQ
jgi:hypothetical protein